MIIPSVALNVSGERFAVVYQVLGSEEEARARAEDICIEQTIEYPADLVPAGGIRDYVFGQIVSFKPLRDKRYEAVITYANEISGFELLQLLNVIFGNISMKPGIRVLRLELPASLLKAFKGPRFGRSGLRRLLGVPDRPLLSTAVKPLGLSAEDLAHQAYQCALGGIDIIKDDHGLSNQAFAPFEERVKRCAEAVARANQETRYKCIYAPNISRPVEEIVEKAHFAKEVGAGGLMVLPGLSGLDTMRRLADDDSLGLPIILHPAFQGSFVLSEDFGISHYALHGQISRLAGADVSVIPNYVGRFSYTREECRSVAEGTVVDMHNIKPNFPAPGGGIGPDSFADMLKVYGADVVYLISGNLHRLGTDLSESSRRFRQVVEQM
jgi:ribulose-bisphosphate carboxylase large chain